jgi:uncharacterized protein (TIGR02145 family)
MNNHLIVFYCLLLFSSCSSDSSESQKNGTDQKSTSEAYGLFTDSRDSNTYRTILMKDNKVWLADNVRYNVAGSSWAPNGQEGNVKRYGRLYNWNGAMKACPNGWHIPSELEWWNLLKEYGGAYIDEGEEREGGSDGKKAYWNLKEGGHTMFDAAFAGVRSRMFSSSPWKFRGFGESVYYWTGTYVDNEKSYALGVSPSHKIYRFINFKSYGYSCRCIKD